MYKGAILRWKHKFNIFDLYSKNKNLCSLSAGVTYTYNLITYSYIEYDVNPYFFINRNCLTHTLPTGEKEGATWGLQPLIFVYSFNEPVGGSRDLLSSVHSELK